MARVLNEETRRLYESTIPQSQIPTLDSLLDFVSQRCKILANIDSNAEQLSVQTVGKKNKGGPPEKSSLTVTSQTNESKCTYCEHEHPLYRCFSFKQKPAAYRRNFVSKNGVCFMYLTQGHRAKSCSATFKC